MARLLSRLGLLAFAVVPFVFVYAQDSTPKQSAPTCEQVFKDIQVFKGIPATELIPSMEFMSASLKFECTDCHDPKDYAADTEHKSAAREMVKMQRDINDKHFEGRTVVTCMTCHRGSERPRGVAVPDGIVMRHAKMENAPEPKAVFDKALKALGKSDAVLVRTGTLTGPNDMTHKVETLPLEFAQGPDGKYKLDSGGRKIISDGVKSTYSGGPLMDEPAYIFARMGRSWRDQANYDGLSETMVSGKDAVDKTPVTVVRGTRTATTSTEELYFDSANDLLLRMTNARRTPLGTEVTAIDYSDYRTVGSLKVPMKVVITFAGNEQWIMEFKDAKVVPASAYAFTP